MKPTEKQINDESKRLADEFMDGVEDPVMWQKLRDMFECGIAFRDSYITTEEDIKKPSPKLDMVVITESILERGKSKNGGWSRLQISLLGENQDVSGWRKRLIGKTVRQSQVTNFINHKDAHLQKKKKF